MFTQTADIYDLIYSFKNYEAEARQIKSQILTLHPAAKTVLDMGCGTAEHHRYLKDDFCVDGIDLNDGFIQLARNKNFPGQYHTANMIDFNLEKKYDVILCLFSSIGYLKSFSEIVSALHCFKSHLNDDGLIMVEPWFTRDMWTPGKIQMLSYDKDDYKICRINHSFLEGDFSVLNFHYLIATKDEGVKYLTEKHELRLTAVSEMLEAFDTARLSARFEEKGLVGRGMYYGRQKPVSHQN